MNKEKLKSNLTNASIALSVLGVVGAIAYFSLVLAAKTFDITLEDDEEEDWWK